jgi:hypothetical protein
MASVEAESTVARATRRQLARAWGVFPGRICTVATLFLALACSKQTSGGRPNGYRPRTREVTVTTVPLLVKEAVPVYPFLKPAFAKGGVLDGKEVYAFSPSTITAVEGDTLH